MKALSFITICTASAHEGDILPASPVPLVGMPHHTIARGLSYPVGTVLRLASGVDAFKVVGHATLPSQGMHAVDCMMFKALTPSTVGRAIECQAVRENYALAWVTLSDKGSRGERVDESGPLIASMVAADMDLCHAQGFLLPDDERSLRALLMDLALTQGYDIILTTGGTGVGPRDVSPEATRAVIEKHLYGFEMAMTQCSLTKTPHGAISRAVVGTLGRSLIVNLPGSMKAVRENLAAILPAIPHAVAKLQGDPSDCGS